MKIFMRMLLILVSLVLVGCGGGGSSPTSVTKSLSYSGKTSKAKLTEENTKYFIALVDASFSNIVLSSSNLNLNRVSALHKMSQKVINDTRLNMKVIDSASRTGQISGKLSVVVEETGVYTGTITYTYENFSDTQGVILNGKVINYLTVDSNGVVIKSIIEYQNFNMKIQSEDLNIDGKISSTSTQSGASIIENYVINNNKTNKMLKYENFKTMLNIQRQVVQYSGKIYDSDYGYVNVSTIVPLSYNEDGSRKAEGEILLEGDTSSTTIKYAYDNRIRIEIDVDKDGTIDAVQVYQSGNYEQEIPNAAPVINITFPQSIFTDTDMSEVTVDVYDPDLDGFTISNKWKINGVVKGDVVALDNTLFRKHDMLKLAVTATDDRVGDVKISTQSKEQEVLNTSPVAIIEANATSNSIEALDTIQFDASSSTDKDNDALTYNWKVYKYIPEEEWHGEPILETVLPDNKDIVSPNFIIEVNASKYIDNSTLEKPVFSAGAEGKHIIKCTVFDDEMAENTTELNLTIQALEVIQNTESKIFFPDQNILTEWTSGKPIYAYDLNNDGEKELLYFTKDPNDGTQTLLHITYSPKSENSITNSYDINDSAIFNIKDFKDFNADGKVDIILGGYKNSIMLQTTQDTFANPYDIFIYSNMPLIEDVNGDEKIDGIRLNGCTLEIYTNFDDFSQIETTYTVKGCKAENSNNILQISDFNNDGIDDYMIFSHSTYDEKGQFVVVYRNSQNLLTEGNINLVDERVFSETLSVGDINGDGLNDVIVDFILFENSENFNFQKVQTLDKNNNGSTNDRIIIADINNDNKEDILYHNGDLLRVLVQGDNYLMSDFKLKYVIDNMLISDIDNDGKVEIIENYHNRIEINTLN